MMNKILLFGGRGESNGYSNNKVEPFEPDSMIRAAYQNQRFVFAIRFLLSFLPPIYQHIGTIQ
jgi:hypothetical protein